MSAPAVESSFDVAFWLLDHALNEGEYLQPQKLHRLMFLSQAYFGVAHNGVRLMPAFFIAHREGPVEPNVLKAFEHGRPYITVAKMEDAPRQMLESVWRKFGAHRAEHLSAILRSHAPYAEAAAQGEGTEIPFEAMTAYYSGKSQMVADPSAPDVTKVLRPRVMRSHKGRPVNVRQWTPRREGEG